MKQLITKARDSLADPSNPEMIHEVIRIADRLVLPITEIKLVLDPNTPHRTEEAAGAAVKGALAELAEVKKSGDKARIQAALKDLRESMDRYNSIVSGSVGQRGAKKPVVTKSLDSLQDVILVCLVSSAFSNQLGY